MKQQKPIQYTVAEKELGYVTIDEAWEAFKKTSDFKNHTYISIGRLFLKYLGENYKIQKR